MDFSKGQNNVSKPLPSAATASIVLHALTGTNHRQQQQQQQQQSAGQQTNPVGDINKEANPGFAAHQANPGPAMMPQGVNVPMEGTKEERMAKAEEWNKKGG